MQIVAPVAGLWSWVSPQPLAPERRPPRPHRLATLRRVQKGLRVEEGVPPRPNEGHQASTRVTKMTPLRRRRPRKPHSRSRPTSSLGTVAPICRTRAHLGHDSRPPRSMGDLRCAGEAGAKREHSTPQSRRRNPPAREAGPRHRFRSFSRGYEPHPQMGGHP